MLLLQTGGRAVAVQMAEPAESEAQLYVGAAEKRSSLGEVAIRYTNAPQIKSMSSRTGPECLLKSRMCYVALAVMWRPRLGSKFKAALRKLEAT